MSAVVNTFARVYETRRRPGYVVRPAAIAWDAVAFELDGPRTAVACAPRAALDDFLDRLERGELDSTITAFLEEAPQGRVLKSADQTRKPGLFDQLESRAAIASPERAPGRTALGIGGGGGTPVDARREKDRRPDRPERPRRPRLPKRFVVGATAVASVAVVGAVAVAVTGDDDKKTVATGLGSQGPIVQATLPPLDLPPSPAEPGGDPISASDITGFWTGDWGDLVLRVSDDGKVIATYGFDEGMIVGQLSGRRITGWWCEVPSRKGPGDAGPVQFDFKGDPQASFEIDGRWMHAADSTWSEDWDISARAPTAPPKALTDRLALVEDECKFGV